MIFVGKNKRIVLKMLTANSENTNTMLAGGILWHTHVFFRPVSALLRQRCS